MGGCIECQSPSQAEITDCETLFFLCPLERHVQSDANALKCLVRKKAVLLNGIRKKGGVRKIHIHSNLVLVGMGKRGGNPVAWGNQKPGPNK